MRNALHDLFQRELINWCRRQELPMGLTPHQLLELDGLTTYQKNHVRAYLQAWGEAESRARLFEDIESEAMAVQKA